MNPGRGTARLGRSAIGPVLVPAAVAAVLALTGHGGRALVVAGVAVVVGLLLVAGVPIDRWVARLAVRLAAAVTIVLVTAVGAVAVLFGAVLRLLRVDALRDESRATDGSTWRATPRARAPYFDTRPFSGRSDGTARGGGPRALGLSLRRAAAVAITIVLVAGGLGGTALAARELLPEDQVESGSNRPITYPPWAFPDEPWVEQLLIEGWPVEYHPSLAWKSSDVDGRFVNVSDGVRQSWGGDRGPTVWFLGGSTTYGLGQRDDHTIVSEVARLAAAEGAPIRAVNLGVPGYDQWQEVQLMANRLSRGERPDLVVFYDGNNDLVAMSYRAEQGIVPLDEPPNRFHYDLEPASNYRPEERAGRSASQTELIAAFGRMYGAGVDLGTRIAGSYGVPTAHYFQPSFASTKPSPHDRDLTRAFPELAPGRVDVLRRLEREVRARLPEGVVDLAGALDDAPGPVYFDSVHTNEIGARMIAEAMWPTLRDSVASLPRRSPESS